jgi:peptidoglycan/LPS O-acetylase OafA/YrhL
MTVTFESRVVAPDERAGPRVVRTFRADIEGLRAVAVTLVVLSHLGLGFPGGYVGVDVFFVISGFLITTQLANEFIRDNRISLRRFYARRARRILPAATVVIIATLLASWRWDSPLRVKSDTVDGLFSAFSGINWRLAANGTDYFQASLPPSPFQHYWSLAVEEQFYAVWPALLLAVGLVAGRRFGRRTSLIWTLTLIIAGSLFLSVTTTQSSPSWAYFGAQTRAWELGLGALLALSVTAWTRMPPALACQMSWLGLGLIVFSALIFTSSTPFPGTVVIVPVIGSALVIAGGCPDWRRGAELVLKWRPMQVVGRTSYSWYLVHWPVLTIAPLALDHALTTGQKWLVLFGSFALAVIMFYVVEQPIRTRPLLVRRPSFGLAVGAGLVVASVATALLVANAAVVPGGGAPSAQAGGPASSVSVVENAVAVATTLSALPSNVTPSLTNAPKDHSATGSCLQADTVSVPLPDRECTFGDLAATKTMALVGDSHANAWEPAIDAFAKADHWKVVLYAKAACPPGVYTTYIDPLTNRLYTQCNEWRTVVFDRLLALKPTVVLVTSELRTLDIDPSGLVQAIHNYRASGARVVYLQDTPSAVNIGSIPDCLAKHTTNVQKCSLPRRAAGTRLEGMIQRRVSADAAQRAGALLLDPTNWFCTATVCPPVINNMIVYSDDSHTTATYITWLAPVLSNALRSLVG